MRQELTKKLLNDFPVLYRGYTLPLTDSLMAFGFECGDGWYDAIRKLSERITSYNDFRGGPPIEATQVKEKYGRLRFYVSEYIEDVEAWINEAEEECTKVCERCGSGDNLVWTEGWISRICKGCDDCERR